MRGVRGEPKEVRWIGSSLDDLREMPEKLRKEFGYALRMLQNGETPANASPFEGSRAGEVMRLEEDYRTDTYRVAYAAKFEHIVYVLAAFKKKAKSGIATPRQEIETVYERYRAARQDYESVFGTGRQQRRAGEPERGRGDEPGR